MNKILNIILVMMFSILHSGTDGTIRGQVTDSDGSPLIGAQIYVPKLGVGTTADIDGNYIIINVPLGDYEVRCQMIGYQTNILEGANVTMDQTTWLNFSLPIAAIEGDVVRVSSQKRLVEKGTTSKKVTVSKEAIETLPIKDISDLYNLQSGVVKVESRGQGVPDNAERGLEEVHVRGGRSGEIAYMIDGMYVRNPIWGSIGDGTRLNKFAIREFNWQPGGFDAEYGDAMSAVSNWHTMSGSDEFSYKFQYETSLLGAALGSRYDELRDYHDYNFGLGGALPFYKNIKLWTSAQATSNGSYAVWKFDDHVYGNSAFHDENFYQRDWFSPMENSGIAWDAFIYNDPESWDLFLEMREDMVTPWDNISGYRGFGYDETVDYFTKINWDITSQFKLQFSYWNVSSQIKFPGVTSINTPTAVFTPFLYWDEGKNELFSDTERYAFELNHTINKKSFYTLRYSKFIQDKFLGVRHRDSDNDGFPDWFEWRNKAGYAEFSDPYNWQITPFHIDNAGLSIYYDLRDGSGPEDWSSGWYYGAEPGNYNWFVAEDFIDLNENGLCDNCPTENSDIDPTLPTEFDEQYDADHDGLWDGPVLLNKAIYRDGDYWLTPEMYVDNEMFQDAMGAYLYYEGLAPTMTTENGQHFNSYFAADSESEDEAPLYFRYFAEGMIFGGTDKYFEESRAETNEIRLDFTSQVTNRWRTKLGFDYKTHKLQYNQVKFPWDGPSAFRQRFAEQWDDVGIDGEEWAKADCQQPDFGEGNGVWDGPQLKEDPCEPGVLIDYPGEAFDDFNGDGLWNNYVEPEEFAAYWQNTYEVPWMVINLGVRLDAVQYNTKIWTNAEGIHSPYEPNFYFDCGTDLNIFNQSPMCPSDEYILDSGFNYSPPSDDASYDISITVGDNEFYTGFETDSQTGEYIVDDDGFWIYTSDAIEQFNLCANSNDWTLCDYDNNGIVSNVEISRRLEEELIVFDELSAAMTDNEYWDEGEATTDDINDTNPTYSHVIFSNSDWLYKVSPRLGISHVISDGATFTFNYGLYYQTPIYEFIYRNVNKLENPEQAFEEAGRENSSIGNATMVAGRTQSYELAFNIELTRAWAFTAGLWVKDMDQLTTSAPYTSGVYEFDVAKNGDFGTAYGFDFSIENRGKLFHTTVQYTYSIARASSEYDAAAFGEVEVDSPQQEFLMPYDRTHDLTLSLYSTKLPFGINGGLTAFFQSGAPYTGRIWNGDKPEPDYKNKNALRMPNLITMDISLSKEFEMRKHTMMVGMNIYNLFDKPYTIDVYEITGTGDDPGTYYDENISIDISSAYYDRPWLYSPNREINFFIRLDFN